MRAGYRLSVSPEEGDEFKLVWSDHFSDLQPYCVSGALVTKASEEIRGVLNALSKHYRECEVTGAKPDYSPFYPDLARAGAHLSEALLNRSSGEQGSADEARSLISSIEGQIPLTIVISGTPLHVPWSFAFRGDLDSLPPTSGTLGDFKDFWTNVFDINISYSRTTLLKAAHSKDAAPFVLHALHEEHFSNARALLTDAERAVVDQLLTLRIGNTTDWDTCRRKWRKSDDADSIIYIFGHSDGQNIFLSEDNDPKYILDANGFRLTFRKPAGAKSNTICFINGCRTCAGLLGSSFIAATASQGFFGFIGSEAEVSNLFAARYGADFMKKLCVDRLSVQDAFAAIRERQDLFPLSLLYSCYAQPDFRLAAPLEGAAA
ncbi:MULTISPECIES: hypothetical protein [unclassified Bradyrhizobium]|uniref:hypothetical protein n=1 Tax=unclassified Bradyrhizobium TaxID=2631580 RepID=UPI002916CF91|nr:MULTISPECIES: hypothetical protein [unclassified Bradyrhizobium]